MKFPLKLLFFSLAFYLICRVNLHFSLSLLSNKFVLFNFVLILTLVIHYSCDTYDTVTNNDRENSLIQLHDGRLDKELAPLDQSNAIIIQAEAVSQNTSGKEGLEVVKSIILVEKYAKEEQLVEQEETIMDIVYNDFQMKVRNEDDTGWQVVVVESLVPNEVKEIVCVENNLDRLDLDALNRKFDEFISIQKRKWQLDAEKQQLQLVKI